MSRLGFSFEKPNQNFVSYLLGLICGDPIDAFRAENIFISA